MTHVSPELEARVQWALDLYTDTSFSGAVAVAIGPEGDWSPREAECLRKKSFLPVTLGGRILRASTAVAVACGVLALTNGR